MIIFGFFVYFMMYVWVFYEEDFCLLGFIVYSYYGLFFIWSVWDESYIKDYVIMMYGGLLWIL